MAFLINCKIKNVRLDQIDLNNDTYKISKPHIGERLKDSISASGLLNPPVLLKRKHLKKDNFIYQIISGHNRLSILTELNYNTTSAFVLEEMRPEEFIDHTLLKNFRQEIGPVGKIKFVHILRNIFLLNEEDIFFAAKHMQVPENMMHTDLPDRVLSLPDALKNYLDIKDISFKVIKNIMLIPDEAELILAKWTAGISIRVNIFKMIVDHLIDISKRDKSISALAKIDLNSFSNKKRQDESLYHEVYKIRFPEYMQIKSRSDKIINILNEEGVEIDFPEYFQRDEIGVILKVKKRDGVGALKKKIDRINIDAIEEILKLI